MTEQAIGPHTWGGGPGEGRHKTSAPRAVGPAGRGARQGNDGAALLGEGEGQQGRVAFNADESC